MSNTATVTTRKRLTVEKFHQHLRKAIEATYGDSLTLLTYPGYSGAMVLSEDGMPFAQWFLESKGRITLDKRYGSVGYMVAEVITVALARALNGRVYESSNDTYLDLKPEYPLYYMDCLRQNYDRISTCTNRVLPPFEEWVGPDHIEKRLFTGKFAKFWAK